MSSRPRPTTVKPMTLPAENATRRPLFRPSRQALAVRQLALVAIRIPTKPLSPEKNPPVRNANGTNQVSNLQAAIMHKTTIIQAKNTPTTVYCRFRYALAPSRMEREILLIRGVPSSKLRTRLPMMKAKTSAMTAPIRVANTRYFSM